MFAATFALTAAVLHGVVYAFAGDPFRLYAAGRSEKLAVMDRMRGKAFSAVFGSSHAANGFVPRAFDAALAGSPDATTTANLAIVGGSQSEQRRMAIEWVAHLVTPAQAGAPPQPCFVILELGAGANLLDADLVHPRAINIYDLPTTRLISQMTDAAMPRVQRAGRISYALIELGLHTINLGMLSNVIFRPPLDQELIYSETRDDLRGLYPEEAPSNVPGDVTSVVNSAPAHPLAVDEHLLPGNTRMIEEIDRASRVHDLSPVYLVMPLISDTHETHLYPDHLVADGREVPIINMARADLYPEFYAGANWHDGAHLSDKGAALFSARFAATLKQWYAQHGGPIACIQ
jgi:hypothetical protein